MLNRRLEIVEPGILESGVSLFSMLDLAEVGVVMGLFEVRGVDIGFVGIESLLGGLVEDGLSLPESSRTLTLLVISAIGFADLNTIASRSQEL
jgi:hypothetical protein